jgi:hypothetical protein
LFDELYSDSARLEQVTCDSRLDAAPGQGARIELFK